MSKKKRDPLAEELQAIAQMPEKLQERAMDMLDKKLDKKAAREYQGQIFSRWLISLTLIVSFLFCSYFVYKEEYQLAAEFILPAIFVAVARVIVALKH